MINPYGTPGEWEQCQIARWKEQLVAVDLWDSHPTNEVNYPQFHYDNVCEASRPANLDRRP